MDELYLWPASPVASITVLWIASVIFLWAARGAMLKLLHGLGRGLADGLASVAERCLGAAGELRERNREILLAAGTRDAQGRLDRELQRIDAGFSEQLGQYGRLQRRLDDTLLGLENDYHEGGVAPPEVPGWSAAVEAIANIPMAGDPNIQKVLDGIRRSSEDAEKKTLAAYRADTTKRHKILGAMHPVWKEIRSLLGRMQDSVGLALESSARINAFIEDYEKIRQDREQSARALTFSAVKLFVVAAAVLGIAFGAAFINFQLIALPMSELVPAGARVGGTPVSTISALVLVLMEVVLGIFLMDMLGITELFPKLSTMPRARRRLILWLGLAGLFFLAGVESSLAILREQIVEAEAALKLSLAGSESRIVQSASQSMIPVVGQAVLGFVLPWILALVAVPLEMLLDSGRHVAASLAVFTLRILGALSGAAAQVARHLTDLLTSAYDVYIAIPLRLEAMFGDGRKPAKIAAGPLDSFGGRGMKRMMRSMVLASAVALGACAIACDDESRYDQAICVLIDESGTYADQKQEVVGILKREVLPAMEPGDTLLVIRIDDESYQKRNVEALMTLDARPSRANAQKLALAQTLDALARRDVRAEHTDIPGAMMLGSEYLAELDSGSRVMLVFSDMQEDLAPGTRRELSRDEFAGIHVAAMNVKRLGADNADPQGFRGRLADWERRVMTAGGLGWRVFMDASQLAGYLGEVRAG